MPDRIAAAVVLTFLTLILGACDAPGGDDAVTADPVPSAPAAGSASADLSQPLRIVERAGGDHSGITEPGVLLVQSDEARTALGSDALNNLNVDFGQRALIVIALGQKNTGGYWARVSDVTQDGDRLIVHGQANRPGDDAMTLQVMTTPWAAAIIERPAATSVVPRIDSLTGEPPPGD